MATLAALRQALADQLAGITGLRAHASWPGTLNGTSAVVTRRQTDPDTSAGADTITLSVRVMVPWESTPGRAQGELDELTDRFGARSIRAAVDADASLGGVCDDARVTVVEADNLVEYPPGTGVQYLSAEIVVEVL